MRWLCTVLIVLGALARMARADDAGAALFAAAQAYDQEGDYEHAQVLYESYLQSHPESPLAEVARTRVMGSSRANAEAPRAPLLRVVDPPSLLRQGWFWGIVVGAVVVAGTAITLGVVLGGDNASTGSGASSLRISF